MSQAPRHPVDVYIDRMRFEAGLTWGEVAARTGHNVKTLRTWRKEDWSPMRLEDIHALCQAIGADPRVLIDLGKPQ